MAHERDIQSDITLELDGDVSPKQLAGALNALSALLDAGHKQLDPDKAMDWSIQVKQGSNLVEFHPKTAINPALIGNIQRGFKELENGAENLDGFDESMLDNMRALCDISKDTETKKTSVCLWLNRKPSRFTKATKENVKKIMLASEAEAFESYGTIEGKLEILDVHDGNKFAIYDSLHSKKILGNPESDEIFNYAQKLFGKTVEANGLIKYKNGRARQIFVRRLIERPRPPADYDYRSARGILKKYV